MIDPKRRLLLKSGAASGAIALTAGSGLLVPTTVFATWPEAAFKATSIEAALGDLYGSGTATESGDIELNAPEIAENGAVVPVTVKTSITGVESIAIVVAGNGRPLGAELKLTARSVPIVSTRLKVAKSSKIVALVKTANHLFTASRDVKVTIGGCGG